MFSCCCSVTKRVKPEESLGTQKLSLENRIDLEKAIVNDDEVSTSPDSTKNDSDEGCIFDESVDSLGSVVSQRSCGSYSLVEICSQPLVPSAAKYNKTGVLRVKQRSIFHDGKTLSGRQRSSFHEKTIFRDIDVSDLGDRLEERFVAVRAGCLEVWTINADPSCSCRCSLQDLIEINYKVEENYKVNSWQVLTLKFLHPESARSQAKETFILLKATTQSEAKDWFEVIEFVRRTRTLPINDSFCSNPVQLATCGNIWQDFQRLVDHCFMAVTTRDRKGQNTPKRLRVVSVVKVHNSMLVREYNRMQCKVAGELKDDDFKKSYDAITPDVRTSLLDPPAQTLPQLNDNTLERWLFHGTSPLSLEGIAKYNFDMSRAGSGAGELYGKGIYCAECSSKADEYTQEDKNGVRGLLLCRAMLGKILYSSAKSPDVCQLQYAKKAQGCHTILGDRVTAVGTYREFVFGQQEQLFPEFIIYYQRELGGRN
jgi:hypothetical protein